MVDKQQNPNDENAPDEKGHDNSQTDSGNNSLNSEALSDSDLVFEESKVEHEDTYSESNSALSEEDEDSSFSARTDSGDAFDSKNWITNLTAAINNIMELDETAELKDEEAIQRLREHQDAAKEELHESSSRSHAENISSEAMNSDIQRDIMSSSDQDAGQGIMDVVSNMFQSSTEAGTYDNFMSIEEVSDSSDASGESILASINAGVDDPSMRPDANAFNSFRNNDFDFHGRGFIEQKSVSIDWDDIANVMAKGDWGNNPRGFADVLDELGIDSAKEALRIMTEALSQGSVLSQETWSDTWDGYTYTSTTTYYEDGTVVWEDSDGWISVEYPDGSYESVSSDGSWYSAQMDDDGNWSYSAFDATLDMIMKNDLLYNSDGEPMLNEDGSQVTLEQYWNEYYADDEGTYAGDEYGRGEDNTDYASMYEEWGYTQNEESGRWEYTYDDGSVSWYLEDGSTGGYTDGFTGWTSAWDETSNWYEDPEGNTWIDNGAGFSDTDGNFMSYDDLYDTMYQAYDDAWENQVIYNYDGADEGVMQIDTLNYYDTISLDNTIYEQLNLDQISSDDITDQAYFDYLASGEVGDVIYLSDLNYTIDNFVVNNADDATESTRFVIQDDGSVLFDADGAGGEDAEEILSVTDGDINDWNIQIISSSDTQNGDGLS